MKHLDLFSGIGGFSLAASWVWGSEHDIHSFVEIDPFCQKVLKRHWPDVPIISDIRDVTYENLVTNTERFRRRQCGNAQTNRNKKEAALSCKENRTESVPRIDLLTGGFPCQPFSQAGKQGGKEDDRYL